jgi:MOSC domain-containing protein YiiM
MFGENLTISNLDETKIRVGNIYKIGNALVEVTKPREPCFKLGIRFGNQDIVEQFWNNSKSGMYFKILEPGEVAVLSKMELVFENKQGLFISEVYNQKKAKNKKG